MSFFKKLVIIFTSAIVLISQNAYALETKAKSAILIESNTGEVLYEKNAYQKLPMASTTKIMTAICAIENGNLDELVTVDSSAVGVEGSSMYLGHGEKITLENLVYGLMLSSGNDAAVAIAVNVGKSVDGFAEIMNKTAEKIGVKSTCFKNPNGLDEEGHYTTAYDLAMIARYGLSNPEFAKIVKTSEIKIPWDGKEYDRTLKNHNKLLKIYDGATGVKTGFTKKSGRCLVSSAERNGMSVIAVTLSDPNDWNDHISMFNYAFDNYKIKSILKEGEYAGTADVDFSDTESVKLEFAKDVSMLCKNDEKYDISISLSVPESLEAPVNFGAKVGEAIVFADGKQIGSSKVITAGCAGKKDIKKFKQEFKNIVIKYIRGI